MEVLNELQFAEVPVIGGQGRTGVQARKAVLPGPPLPLSLPADSPALHLIQQVRDEAHRFAITGHWQRGRGPGESTLETIAGLGPARRRALLRELGGLQGVRQAGVGDLARVNGISRALAERIYDHFHGQAD